MKTETTEEMLHRYRVRQNIRVVREGEVTLADLQGWCDRWTDEEIELRVPEKDRAWVRAHRKASLDAIAQLRGEQ